MLKPLLEKLHKIVSKTGSSVVDWNDGRQRAIFLVDGALDQVNAFADAEIQRKFREELFAEVLKLAAGASWVEQPNDVMRAHPIFRALLRKLRALLESEFIDEVDESLQLDIETKLFNAEARS